MIEYVPEICPPIQQMDVKNTMCRFSELSSVMPSLAFASNLNLTEWRLSVSCRRGKQTGRKRKQALTKEHMSSNECCSFRQRFFQGGRSES